MSEAKIAPRGSTIIASCWLCNGNARMVCMDCKNGWCEEHLHDPARCIHNRKQHHELRLLLQTGWVEVDEVIFLC